MFTRRFARFVFTAAFCLAVVVSAVFARAQTYTVLYTFGNVSLDPIQPGGDRDHRAVAGRDYLHRWRRRQCG